MMKVRNQPKLRRVIAHKIKWIKLTLDSFFRVLWGLVILPEIMSNYLPCLSNMSTPLCQAAFFTQESNVLSIKYTSGCNSNTQVSSLYVLIVTLLCLRHFIDKISDFCDFSYDLVDNICLQVIISIFCY